MLGTTLVSEASGASPCPQAEQLQTDGITSQAAIARAFADRMVPTPRGSGVWTHTAAACRVLHERLPEISVEPPRGQAAVVCLVSTGPGCASRATAHRVLGEHAASDRH